VFFLCDVLAVVAAYWITYLLRFRCSWGAAIFGQVNAVLGCAGPTPAATSRLSTNRACRASGFS